MPKEVYRLKETYAQTVINKELSILASEDECTLIQTEAGTKLLSIIADSPKSKQEIINAWMGDDSLSTILLILHQFEQEGIVTKSRAVLPLGQAAFWEEMGYSSQQLAAILETKSIDIKTVGDIEADSFVSACKETGIQFTGKPDLFVVLTTDYLHAGLEAINQEALKNQTPWLLIKPYGTTPYIGPLFTPGKGENPCWFCLKTRLMLHNQENRLYQAISQTNKTLYRPVINHPLAQQQIISQSVFEIISYLYNGHHKKLEDKLLEVNFKTGERQTHHVVKRPQCEACGNAGLLSVPPRPVLLNNTCVVSSSAGGYRSVLPEETLARYQHHISPVTGIVPYLKPFRQQADVPIFNFSSGRNVALSSTSLFWLNQHLRSGNGGKGSSEIQAKVGALCESIERYSMMYPGKIYAKSASLRELEKGIHPNECMLFSNEQFENRNHINKNNTKFYSLIPIPFDTRKTMEWTPVYSLTYQEFKYLPSCYCYAQYPSDNEKELYAYPDSNGCAAGNTIEEAILQGFLELAERDAAAIWWYNKIRHPKVDLPTAHNPYITRMADYYRQINRNLYVLDITTDLEIPVFVAISCSLKDRDKILYAFGSHVDAGIALERAIVELNQLLPVFGPDNQSYITKDKVFIDWLDMATLDNNPHFIPLENSIKDIRTDYPQLSKPTIYDSVLFCTETAKKNKIETLVLDLTQPDIGLPVVKVITPGLRHFWRRTAPGRLYDVPVKMGWLATANTEKKLNPWSIFI